MSQARRRWPRDADGMLSLFGARVILSGIADTQTLEQLSLIAGDWDRPVQTVSRQQSSAGLLAVARAGMSLPHLLEIGFDLDAGWAWAWTRITASAGGVPSSVVATADTVALGAGAEIAYPLKPGRLAFGIRYLWIDLERTSQGDQIAGNSAGVIGDLGYKLTF